MPRKRPGRRPPLFKIGCVGRITQLAESGDGRYLLELTGVARFRVDRGIAGADRLSPVPCHLCAVRRRFYRPQGRERRRPRRALLARSRDFLKANNFKADWEGIDKAPNEALVNALAMMSPYGAAEKQALLEAPDLKTRAEILVAITEIELAKKNTEGEPQLQ